jgi:hypothetical protein
VIAAGEAAESALITNPNDPGLTEIDGLLKVHPANGT